MPDDNIIPLHRPARCICGRPGTRRTLLGEGTRVDVVACDECFGDSAAMLDRVRPVFEAMLAAGVERAIASDVMTYLLDRLDPDR